MRANAILKVEAGLTSTSQVPVMNSSPEATSRRMVQWGRTVSEAETLPESMAATTATVADLMNGKTVSFPCV
jgi:hypothetical protein